MSRARGQDNLIGCLYRAKLQCPTINELYSHVKNEQKLRERLDETNLYFRCFVAYETDLADRMAGEQMIIGSGTSHWIIMSRSGVRSRLVPGVQRARAQENSKCRSIARILGCLDS